MPPIFGPLTETGGYFSPVLLGKRLGSGAKTPDKLNEREEACMRATIKMIAEKAGVSNGTVDRVLHDRPYVKAEVRERVLQVMRELDYQPNRMASALATSGVARRFAVIQPQWEPYIGGAIQEGINRFREERRDYNLGVDLYEYTKSDTAACLRQLAKAAASEPQGIALSASDSPEIRACLRDLAEKRIPVVTFNSDIPGAPRLCYVGEDAHHAGRIAGEIAAKFVRPGDSILVAYAGPVYAGHKARANGFLERMGEVGISGDSCRVVFTNSDYDTTYREVTRALREDPHICCVYMANRSVPACVEAIRDCGRTGQVRVVAHDCDPEICELLRAGAVDFTIGQDFTYQSYQALSVLFGAEVDHKLPEQDFYYPSSPILNAEMI